MFTEGLDESAMEWVKQGSEVEQQKWPPLREKYPLDHVSDPPLLYNTKSFLSPRVLPPTKFHSGLLGPHPSVYVASEDDEESVASVPEDIYSNYSDTCEEDGLCSSDFDLFEKPKERCSEEEIKSTVKSNHEPIRGADNAHCRPLVRGLSKENLRVDVAVNVIRANTETGVRGSADRNSVSRITARNYEQDGIPNSRGHLFNDFIAPKFEELQTPSAPPIVANEREESNLDVEDNRWMESNGESQDGFMKDMEQTDNETYFSDGTKVIFRSIDVSLDTGMESHKTNGLPARSISGDEDDHVPSWKTNSADQVPSYTTSVQSAWQTFVAYDACFRLCLNAWARNRIEAPVFLRDECMVLRNAFGLQKFLLQPQGQIQGEGRHFDKTEGTFTVKGRKMIRQIEVEVKKIRIMPRGRKLRTAYSQRAIYMQVGAEYAKHVSKLLKSSINSLKATFPVVPEECLSCLLQLRSSTEDTVVDLDSTVCLKPGTSDSHVFYPESQGDVLFVEVQDSNKVNQGHAAIQISSLTDCHEEMVRWWPVYVDDHECVGKIQLCISISSASDKMGPTKGTMVVETLVYDLVLEAAMRAQNFHSKHLQIQGTWRWLLNEFAHYYGVSDAYSKLRYLSCIMNVATPTKDCLELVYEVILPIIKAQVGKCLTRQERSILLDCEDKIKTLLATTFENYKSLDELSPTGLTDLFVPIVDSAAPALAPAVQIFTLIHDILSQEAQTILRNYLQTAAAKRCRRHMVETDEFISTSYDGCLADPMTISTAYLKMKLLCINISNEIQADIKIHNQHILPSSIDLPNITASLYSFELNKRLGRFLKTCPPLKPSPHVTALLIATADFERQLYSWNISPIHGGVASRNLFDSYITIWIEDMRLHLLDLCKAEKEPCSGITTHCSTSPFAENMYEQIRDNLNEYEVVINRWPQYLSSLESFVAEVERAIMKALEKQYSDILMPLRDSIPKMLEKQVQKFTRRQSTSIYLIPGQLGTFLNTVKRILDVLHCRVEELLKSWASYMMNTGDRNLSFGEQMNGVIVMLRKTYKRYMEAIVEKLITNTQASRSTKLKRILEETKEAEGEPEIRERMQALCLQVTESIHNLHNVFSSRIFVAICRGFWDAMGKIVLRFLESRKENRIWYRGSNYALGILDDLFASEMQALLGNALQEKDLDLPRSVIEARSILG